MIYTSKHIGKFMPADLQLSSFGSVEAGANVGQASLPPVVA